MEGASKLSIGGRLATADDADWDEVRAAWNLAADQRPFAVAFVESSEDVSRVVGFARDNGLRVAAQGTGHGAVALGSLDNAILVKTERMRAIEVEDSLKEDRLVVDELRATAVRIEDAQRGGGELRHLIRGPVGF